MHAFKVSGRARFCRQMVACLFKDSRGLAQTNAVSTGQLLEGVKESGPNVSRPSVVVLGMPGRKLVSGNWQ